MLHFAATEMCLFVFLFSFQFPALEVPRSKIQKGGNFKIIFPVPYPIIYNPGSVTFYTLYKIDIWKKDVNILI